jgi:3-oxoacyl-[acyl-carrier-protein] synthase-1
MTAVAQPAEILAIGMVTPVGLYAASAAAAVRAGVSRVRESRFYGKLIEPHRMSLVPEDAMPPLAPALEAASVSMTPAHSRMLLLAGAALQQVAPLASPAAPALFLGLPEARPGEPDAVGPSFLAHLATQAQIRFDPFSRLRREGGAAGLFALHDALLHLQAHKAECVIAGGVDTFRDLRRLTLLDLENRLLSQRVADGFIPGEGAAVLLLASLAFAKRHGARPIARVVAAATGLEPGHRYSSQPYKGEGLAATFQELFAAAPSIPPVRCIYAGFNGENMPAKEWGVAHLRSSGRIASDAAIEHPGDCIGDTGAAMGPLLLGFGAIGIHSGYRRSPCLIWCTSDREPRSAALIEAA